MNNTGGALSFNASINDGDFNRTIDQMTRKTGVFGKKVSSEADQIAASFNRMAKYAAGAFAGMQLAQLPGQIVKVRGEFQQLEIALNTMLQSRSKANVLTQQIVEAAASTPFGLKDLAAGTKSLLAYGSTAESVIDEIRMLGDVASGVSAPIGDLIYLYGTLRSQGRAYAVDIRQFAGRGIPIYAELAKVLNVNVSEVSALVEAGRVGFPEIEQAFKNMTAAGSMFGGLMDAQSKSLPGLIERLSDATDVMLNEIGKSNQGLAENVIKGGAYMVEHYQDIIDVLTVLVSTYGAYKAAVVSVAAINRVTSTSALIAEANALESLLNKQQKLALSKSGLKKGTLEYAQAIKTTVDETIKSNQAEIESLAIQVNHANKTKKAAQEHLAASKAKTIEAHENLRITQQTVAAEVAAARQKAITNAQLKLETQLKRENTAAEAQNQALKKYGNAVDALNASSARVAALREELAQLKATAGAEMTAAQARRIASAEKKLQTQIIRENTAAEAVNAAAKRVNAASDALATAKARTNALREELVALQANTAGVMTSTQARKIAAAQRALDTQITIENSAAEAYNAAMKDRAAKKAALVTVAQTTETMATKANTAANVKLSAVQSLRIALMRKLIALQTAFNASMLSNPIVLATTAVVALGVAMWALHDSTTAQERAQENLNKRLEEANKRKQDLESRTSSLNSIIRDENQTRYAQIKAFRDLQKLFPDVIGNMSLYEFQALSTAEAQKILNKAIEEMGKSQESSEYEKALEKLEELEKKLKNLTDLQGGVGGTGVSNAIEKTRKDIETARIELEEMGKQMKEREELERIANASIEERKAYYEDLVKSLEKQRSEIDDSLTGMKGLVGQSMSLSEIIAKDLRLIGLNKDLQDAKRQLADINNQLNPTGQARNKNFWEKEKEKFEGALAMLDVSQAGSSEWRELVRKIEHAQSMVDKYSTRSREQDMPKPFGSLAYWEQVAKKAQEIIEKTDPSKAKGAETIKKQQEVLRNAQLKAEQAKLDLMPFGSIEYWEQVEKIARDIMANTPMTNQAEIEKQKQVIAKAQEKADEIRKAQAVRSFEEELDYKRKQYELYERWVRHMGKESADAQFASLIQGSGSFAEHLEALIAQYSSQALSGGVISDRDAERLDLLRRTYNDLVGAKSPIELLQQQMDNARESSASLTDELIELARIRNSLDPNDKSAEGYEARLMIAEREVEIMNQRKKLLREFLQNVIGSEQKRNEIAKYYNDLRTQLDKEYTDKKSEAYQKALGSINSAEKQELEELSVEAYKASVAYKELARAAALLSRTDTKGQLALLRKELEGLPEDSEAYKDQLVKIAIAEREHKKAMLDGWSAVADMVADLGDLLGEYDGALGEIGSTIAGIGVAASQVSKVLENMDSYISKSEDGSTSLTSQGYVAAAQGVVSIISSIISANRKRIEEERQFAAERIGFENDYALALNRRIGQQFTQNPFYTDYDGMIRAGVEQYQDALDKYMDAIDKLEEGRVKERQKDVVDGKTVLGSAGAGAATGAIIGSVIPGVGTAIGAVVGGVVGAIGGLFAKKKKDVYASLLEQYPELVKQTAEGWAELNVEMAQALITNNQVDDKTRELLEYAIALNEEMQKAKQQIQDTVVDLTGQIGDNLRNALVEAFRAGDEAAQALHKTVGNIIADVASKLLFSRLVGPVLDQLTEEMATSLTEGDGSIIDDLVRFEKYGLPAVEQYFEGLSALEEWAKQNGFEDLFGRAQGANAEAISGSIRGISEETASVLVGQFNAVRMYQADMANNMRISVTHLSSIAANTAYNKYLVRLEAIENTLNRIEKASGGRSLGI